MNIDELKSKRIKYALTQKKIAEKLGMSTKTYNRKELGIVDFSREEIEKIAKILNLNTEDIMSIFFGNNIT